VAGAPAAIWLLREFRQRFAKAEQVDRMVGRDTHLAASGGTIRGQASIAAGGLASRRPCPGRLRRSVEAPRLGAATGPQIQWGFDMDIGTRSGLELRQTRRLAMTVELRRAIGLLHLDNAALTTHLAAVARRNPALLVTAAVLPAGHRGPRAGPPAPVVGAGGRTDLAEATLAQPGEGLCGHATGQVALLLREPADRLIGLALAEALEPSGWLGLPISDIARRSGHSLPEVERVLERLQSGVEPAGLFARNLAECLRIQAADRGILDGPMEALLLHLDLLARGQVPALADLCGIAEAEVAVLAARLRRLDPKPGAAFGSGPPPVRPPDVIVTAADGGGWRVDLNDATTPQVEVRPPSEDALPDAVAREAALAEARWLQHAVARRNATILAVVSAVVALQDGFLRHGASGLRPLTRAQVADRAGVHETTVGRVAAGMLVAAPLGSHPLRSFFGAAVAATDGGEPVAAGVVRHRIAAMVRAETPSRPLNDAVLTSRLNGEGIAVARRTVAKYREMLGIPPVAVRRARALLGAAATTGDRRANPSR